MSLRSEGKEKKKRKAGEMTAREVYEKEVDGSGDGGKNGKRGKKGRERR